MHEDKKILREISSLFTAKSLRAFADNGLCSIEQPISLLSSITNSTYSDYPAFHVFEDAFELLTSRFRNEYTYKNFLLNKILLGRHSLNSSSMISELRVGRAKADCVMFNGKSTCYEIKTERDSLERLDMQLGEYKVYFDQVFVVLSFRDLERYIARIPPEYGVLTLTEKNSFSVARKPKQLCEKYTADMACRVLRTSELVSLIDSLGESTKNIPNTELVSFCRNVLDGVDGGIIKSKVFSLLKIRGKQNNSLISELPRSLKAAGLAYKFSVEQRDKLMCNLTSKVIKMEH